jgi:hypothetical protein
MVVAALFVLGLGGVAIGIILHFLKRYQKHIETIQNTPQTTAGRLEPGLHKVIGTAVALDQPIISPLSQKECVFYHFRVEQLVTSQQGERRNRNGLKKHVTMTSTWQTVINDKRAVRCGLQDETGMAQVDLLGAEMVLKTDTPKQSNVFNSCPPELQETLKRNYEFSTTGLMLNKSLRYTEMVIRPGDPIYVLGDVEVKDGQPTFVKRGSSFIVSDKEEADLIKHYQRHIIGFRVGMGLAAVVALLFACIPVYMLVKTSALKSAITKKMQAAPAKAEKKPQAWFAPVVENRVAAVPEPRIAPPAEPTVPALVEVNAVPSVPPKAVPPAEPKAVPPAEPKATPAAEAKAAPPPAAKVSVPLNTPVYIVCAANGRTFEAERERKNQDGSRIVLRPNDRIAAHRQWAIRRVPGTEYFTFTNLECNRLLDGERASSYRDGTKVHLYGTRVDGNKERLWQIKAAGGDSYFIVNVANGRYLDADLAASKKKITPVRLWGKTGDDKSQRKWKFVRVKP